MKSLSRASFLLCALVMLQACAIFGAPTPKTFNERLAAGLTLNIEVRGTATTLLQANVISVEDAENTLKVTDSAREAIDLARAFGQTPRGEDKLTFALTILTQARDYLNKRKPQ